MPSATNEKPLLTDGVIFLPDRMCDQICAQNAKSCDQMRKWRGETVKNFKQFNGRGDRIRTCDIYVPNVALYQSELHPGL